MSKRRNIEPFQIGAVLLFFLVGMDAGAAVKNIRRTNLPRDPAVQSAYDDIAKVESMVQSWSQRWEYPTPKDDVVARVGASISGLRKAAQAWPDNEELQLFLGLVAHYSYNLDVEESYDLAKRSLERAATLEPRDYRPQWFLGLHQCQSLAIKEGMNRLLAVEQQSTWDHLPPEFWDDYLSCAHLSNMPAHGLRAADRANHLDPDHSKGREFLVGVLRKQFLMPDPAKPYAVKEVWQAQKDQALVIFISPMFGMEFSLPGEFKITPSGAKNAVVTAVIEAGPFRGKAGDVIPNFLVVARQPKPGESLEDVLHHAQVPGSSMKAIAPPACPVKDCLAAEFVIPGAYHEEGDAHVTTIVFRRDEPEYPGLFLEEPIDLPKTESGDTKYFLPDERLRRLPGTLYYLVTLDTADSVKESAQKAYAAFLKTIRVE